MRQLQNLWKLDLRRTILKTFMICWTFATQGSEESVNLSLASRLFEEKKKKKKNQTQRNQILPIIGVILLSRAREGSRFTNFASFHERKLREKSFSFYFLLIDASAIDRCFNNRGSTVRAISLNNRLVNETINKQKKIIIINLTENSTRIDALKF